jgi:hypothetical protein
MLLVRLRASSAHRQLVIGKLVKGFIGSDVTGRSLQASIAYTPPLRTVSIRGPARMVQTLAAKANNLSHEERTATEPRNREVHRVVVDKIIPVNSRIKTYRFTTRDPAGIHVWFYS